MPSAPLRTLLPLLLALAAGCADVPPASPQLVSVSPPAARVTGPVALTVEARGLVVRTATDFNRADGATVVSSYQARLVGPAGEVALPDFTRVSTTAATATIPAAVGEFPGDYDLVVLDPWGRELRLDGAFRALRPCESPDPTAPREGQPCDGEDSDACADDVWTCAGETLACPGGDDDVELCDGADNDCNGTPDDLAPVSTYSGPPGTEGVGLCRARVESCAGGNWTVSQPEVLPATEVCDGADNDCNALTDEVLPRPYYTGPNGTAGVGVCRAGTEECVQADWTVTAAEVTPGTEVCDGLDNDCNASTDELAPISTYSGPPATRDVGTCRDQVETCSGGDWTVSQTEVLPAAESCDARDEDCDGTVDDLAPVSTYSGPPGTEGVGVCRAKIESCSGGSWTVTQTQVLPSAEVCDGLDNDCVAATPDGNQDTRVGTACDGADTDTCAEGTYYCPVGGSDVACTDTSSNGCAVSAAVGTFTKTNAGTVTQSIAHNLGDVPKALLLWTTGDTVLDSYTPAYRFAFGLTDETRTSGAVSAASADNDITGGYALRRMAPVALTLLRSDRLAPIAEAVVTGWDASSFQLTWTVNDVVASGDTRIHFLVLAGAGVRSKLRGWQMPTTPGSVTYGGYGFSPSAVLVAHAGSGFVDAPPATIQTGAFGLGALDAATNDWALTYLSGDGVQPTATARAQRNTAAVVAVTTDAVASKVASHTGMTSDGFTLNYTVSTNLASQTYSLALAGLSTRASCFDQDTTRTAPFDQQVPGAGFTPVALLMGSIQYGVSTELGGANFALGAASGPTRQAAVALNDRDGVNTSAVETVTRTGFVYLEPRDPPHASTGDGARASLASFDPDGFTLRWTIGDTAATRLCYLALGP